jgi:hypothetical protein
MLQREPVVDIPVKTGPLWTYKQAERLLRLFSPGTPPGPYELHYLNKEYKQRRFDLIALYLSMLGSQNANRPRLLTMWFDIVGMPNHRRR